MLNSCKDSLKVLGFLADSGLLRFLISPSILITCTLRELFGEENELLVELSSVDFSREGRFIVEVVVAFITLGVICILRTVLGEVKGLFDPLLLYKHSLATSISC